jgi:hypothetical protein
MTKQELIESVRAKKEAADVKAQDNETLKNIEVKTVEDVKPAENITPADVATPEQKEVEKAVAAAVEPVVPADEDGVSKNGGEAEMTAETIESEKKKEDKAFQDIVNVTGRTYEENAEVQKELLTKLDESIKANEKLKLDMAHVQSVCKEALAAQRKQFAESSAEKTAQLIESIIAIGEGMEAEMAAEIATSKKNLAKVEATLKASNKLNNILREGLIANRAEKKMVRYESAMKKLTKIVA